MKTVPKSVTVKTSPVTWKHVDAPIKVPRIPVVTTDKQRAKLVSKIERYARRSMEYKNLTAYIRKHLDMDECAFLQNFKAGKKRGMIEIHHAPYNLYTITDIVARKYEEKHSYIDELPVAEEVMRLHYLGLIGLIPLSITCHQLVHDDKLVIPLWCVYGRFVEFTEMYYKWIPDAMLDSLKESIRESMKFKEHPELLKERNSILNVQYVYLQVEGETTMQSYAATKEGSGVVNSLA